MLGVSPVLLERYLEAAGKISSLAVGDPDIGPAGETFRIRQDASQDTHIEGLPIGTVGGILAKPTLPLDGEYDLSVKLFRTNLGVDARPRVRAPARIHRGRRARAPLPRWAARTTSRPT